MIEINKCNNFFLKKNGKFKFYPDSMYKFILLLCVLNNNILFYNYINNIEIFGKNNKEIVEKKKILKKAMKYKLLVYKIENKNNKFYYLFKEENIDDFIKLLYIDEKIKTILKKRDTTKVIYILYFIKYKLTYKNYSNTDIFTLLFFFVFVKFKLLFLKNKYSKTERDFSNYHELYLFLKNIELVDLFYKGFKPYILDNYKKIYKEIMIEKEFEVFKKKELQNIEPYN